MRKSWTLQVGPPPHDVFLQETEEEGTGCREQGQVQTEVEVAVMSHQQSLELPGARNGEEASSWNTAPRRD